MKFLKKIIFVNSSKVFCEKLAQRAQRAKTYVQGHVWIIQQLKGGYMVVAVAAAVVVVAASYSSVLCN